MITRIPLSLRNILVTATSRLDVSSALYQSFLCSIGRWIQLSKMSSRQCPATDKQEPRIQRKRGGASGFALTEIGKKHVEFRREQTGGEIRATQ
jgi:hypothetical protein